MGADAGTTRVLVADDHALMGRVLRRTFERHGWEVTVEANPDRVAETAGRIRPDLVLVDIHMSPREPFFALESLRRPRGRKKPAIIALSGDGSAAIGDQARKRGADAFLAKPWDGDELIGLAELLISG